MDILHAGRTPRSGPLPVPGILLGAYPERRGATIDWRHRVLAAVSALAAPLDAFRLRRYRRFVDAVGALGPALARLSPAAIDDRIERLRASLSRSGFAEPLLVEAFALIRHASERTLGRRPYDTQLIAARVMFDKRVAEMATGEGKTLAAAVCAAAGALAGVPVHVITVNDYLVERDADLMRPLYAALGLTVGHIAAKHDLVTRKQAYACDITYCTARDLVFDYLRDRTVRNPLLSEAQHRAAELDAPGRAAPTLLRGLCMAVVDEADSILLDEARIPLILSTSSPDTARASFHALALDFARRLVIGRDCAVDPERQHVALTDAGRTALGAFAASQPGAWRNRLHREEATCTALAALHTYHPDRHYLVRDGKIVIIDAATGRLAPGRMWGRGLHQMIELKEGCKPSADQVTASQITYQRFFRRYLHLGGMSGTVSEAGAELAAVYGLEVVRVPLRRPSRRTVFATRLFRDRATQWNAVIARTIAVARTGRPVLIGTDSVAESEELAAHLAAARVPHAVLNARHDATEAHAVEQAGRAGRITVTTNMAGRGTDIPLAPGVAERGGLHVICCQHNASRRIDRQLIGRCGRQGDPGSAETMLALDKPRIARVVPRWITTFTGPDGWQRPAWLVSFVVRLPQWLDDRAQRLERREVLARDHRTEQSHAVPGGLE